jgi:hypothetical protein
MRMGKENANGFDREDERGCIWKGEIGKMMRY